MKLIKNDIKQILYFFTLCLISFLVVGCVNDDQSAASQGDASISLTVKAASTDVNTDKVLWEDRVDELRMLVFDSQSGEAVFNEKLYFPDGFAAQSKAVRLRPGTYDFYFIANETVYTGDFVSALLSVTSKTDFTTDTRFKNLAYNPAFKPDETGNDGRFIMSAIYENIAVVSGGTETNPLPLNLPTDKVELIRALAKVEVVFRKKVSGSTIPANTITSVRLDNVSSSLSAPPFDDYYTGSTVSSNQANLTALDYGRDSIGSVSFYIPEFLIPENGIDGTELNINNETFPIQSDSEKAGLSDQRRTSLPALSDNSVIRNYYYVINAYLNAEGGIEIRVYVEPWRKDEYEYIFHGDKEVVIPPVIPTDSSIIIPVECGGKIEILSNNETLSLGLQGAYNDVVNYYDPDLQGPTIYKGDPPYYCEKKYGAGWRLINSCELMSFLSYCDAAYNIWTSNTWDADTWNMPYYSLALRQTAQSLLEKLTGYDLSSSVLYDQNNHLDALPDMKLGLIDQYFTPGDIMVREMDYPTWPYPSPPGTGSSESWFYNEVTIQVRAYWYGATYLSPSDEDNWDTILYHEFRRYDYGSTVSRCVRVVE